MLRGGIVGLGNVAVHGHLPGWRRRTDARIVAVTDALAERRRTAERLLPEARWHPSPGALLDAGLDFVDICTPPSSHAALIEQALRRDVHVLCEKPLVASPDALPAVLELARARDRVVHTVHNWHHAPIVRRAVELIDAGAIGRVRHVAWETLRTRPAAAGDALAANWRLDPAIAGGGVLTDHGWHAVYLVCRFVGREPVAVGARLETRRHHGVPVEDTAAVSLEFPGAAAEILLTWAADERRNRATIQGSAGSLVLDDDALVLTRAGGSERWSCPPALSDGSHHPDRFDPVADDFVRAMRGDGPANVAEARVCVAVEALARESNRQGGRALRLEPLGATVAARPCA